MKKKELTHEERNTKNKIWGAIFILLYIFLPSTIYEFSRNYYLSLTVGYTLLFIISIVVFYPKLKNDFIYSKKNYKEFFKDLFRYFGIFYVIYIISIALVALLLQSNVESMNQQLLENMSRVFIVISSLTYAPFVEELVFRVSIKRFINNKYIYIIVAGLFFGLLHVISENTWHEFIIQGIPYVSLGCYLAYLYETKKNIWLNVGIHFLNNLIGVLIILLFR